MGSVTTILKYLAAGLIVVIIGCLTGWYLYLRSQTASTSATDAARGLNVVSPVFSGNTGSSEGSDVSGVQQGTTTVQSGPPKRLWEVDYAPVAGMSFGGGSASSTALYFVERGNGYVFEADADAQTVQRLTDTLMPKIYQAILIPGKQSVLLRSLDDQGAITTFAGTFASSSTTTSKGSSTLSGQTLANNILNIAADPKTGALFYLTPNTSTYGVVGTSAGWNDVKPKQLFSSSITGWQVQFADGKTILTENAADDTPGYSYTLSGTGTLIPLVGPVDGLEVLPNPSENALLYSSSDNGVLTLSVEIGNKPAVQLPIETVAEKCVWAPGESLIAYCAVPATIPSAHFLDDWYKGLVHTADTWWQIDTSAGTAEVLFTPNQAFDVEQPAIDPSGNYLAFLNGSDQSLWVLRIPQ